MQKRTRKKIASVLYGKPRITPMQALWAIVAVTAFVTAIDLTVRLH